MTSKISTPIPVCNLFNSVSLLSLRGLNYSLCKLNVSGKTERDNRPKLQVEPMLRLTLLTAFHLVEFITIQVYTVHYIVILLSRHNRICGYKRRASFRRWIPNLNLSVVFILFSNTAQKIGSKTTERYKLGIHLRKLARLLYPHILLWRLSNMTIQRTVYLDCDKIHQMERCRLRSDEDNEIEASVNTIFIAYTRV